MCPVGGVGVAEEGYMVSVDRFGADGANPGVFGGAWIWVDVSRQGDQSRHPRAGVTRTACPKNDFGGSPFGDRILWAICSGCCH